MQNSPRLYLCARCGRQVLICRHCDHGNVYCAEVCAKAARKESVREAGRRYQRTIQGRKSRAKCNLRYRRNRIKKTHQGSPEMRGHALLTPAQTRVDFGSGTASAIPKQRCNPGRLAYCCQFCGHDCSEFVRTSFLRRRSSGATHPIRLLRREIDDPPSQP